MPTKTSSQLPRRSSHMVTLRRYVRLLTQPTVSYVGVHEKTRTTDKTSQRTGIQLQKLVGLDGTAPNHEGEIMETYEPDGSPARYMGSKALSLSADYNPDIKKNWSSLPSRSRLYVASPTYPPFAYGSSTYTRKTAYSKKKDTAKNTNYMVVNEGDHITPDHSYHFRCWSQKYECCKGAKTDKMPLPKDLARADEGTERVHDLPERIHRRSLPTRGESLQENLNPVPFLAARSHSWL